MAEVWSLLLSFATAVIGYLSRRQALKVKELQNQNTEQAGQIADLKEHIADCNAEHSETKKELTECNEKHDKTDSRLKRLEYYLGLSESGPDLPLPEEPNGA